MFTRCPTGGKKKIACIYGLRSKGVKEKQSLNVEGALTRSGTCSRASVAPLNSHSQRIVYIVQVTAMNMEIWEKNSVDSAWFLEISNSDTSGTEDSYDVEARD